LKSRMDLKNSLIAGGKSMSIMGITQ
jgi:hypothetical protein